MPLIERVLAATEGGEFGARAVTTGASLARRAGARFEIVTIVEVLLLPPVASSPIDTGEHEDSVSQEALDRAQAQALDAGAGDATVHVQSGFPAPLISRVAERVEADLIVLGGHPHAAITRFIVGSTAERVIRTANRPVLVAVEPRTEPFQRVLVAVDLSTQSRRVLRAAGAIADADDAQLRVLHAQEPVPPMLLETGQFDRAAYQPLGQDNLSSTVAEAGLPESLKLDTKLRQGKAGDAVLAEAAEWNADLVVMGSHGFGFFERLLLGSTSLHVLRHAERATVVVPPVHEQEP